jgi:hypothetical protein
LKIGRERLEQNGDEDLWKELPLFLDQK